MNRSTPCLPVHHQLPELTQTHVHRVSDAIQPSHPLSFPSPPTPIPPSIRVFSHESILRIIGHPNSVSSCLCLSACLFLSASVCLSLPLSLSLSRACSYSPAHRACHWELHPSPPLSPCCLPSLFCAGEPAPRPDTCVCFLWQGKYCGEGGTEGRCGGRFPRRRCGWSSCFDTRCDQHALIPVGDQT